MSAPAPPRARRGGSGVLSAARALLLLLAVRVASSWVCEDVPAPIRYDECEALRVLDAALEGGPTRLLGWGEPVFMCSWGGVQCDLRFRVIYLEFETLQLNGTLEDAPDALNQLTQLKHLLLDGNNIRGRVPKIAELSELTVLRLFGNQFTGPMPDLLWHSQLSALGMSLSASGGDVKYMNFCCGEQARTTPPFSNSVLLTLARDLILCNECSSAPVPPSFH